MKAQKDEKERLKTLHLPKFQFIFNLVPKTPNHYWNSKQFLTKAENSSWLLAGRTSAFVLNRVCLKNTAFCVWKITQNCVDKHPRSENQKFSAQKSRLTRNISAFLELVAQRFYYPPWTKDYRIQMTLKWETFYMTAVESWTYIDEMFVIYIFFAIR